MLATHMEARVLAPARHSHSALTKPPLRKLRPRRLGQGLEYVPRYPNHHHPSKSQAEAPACPSQSKQFLWARVPAVRAELWLSFQYPATPLLGFAIPKPEPIAVPITAIIALTTILWLHAKIGLCMHMHNV
jgi:hypothetical protein